MNHPNPHRHHPVTMADDQQTVTVGGKKFAAHDGEPGRCLGCSFVDGFSCALWRFDQSPRCQPSHRHDQRHIVWKPIN